MPLLVLIAHINTPTPHLNINFYAPTSAGRGITKRWVVSVCRMYRPNSKRPRKPTIGRMEVYHTGNPWTYLDVKKSKVKVTRLINAVTDNAPYAGLRHYNILKVSLFHNKSIRINSVTYSNHKLDSTTRYTAAFPLSATIVLYYFTLLHTTTPHYHIHDVRVNPHFITLLDIFICWRARFSHVGNCSRLEL